MAKTPGGTETLGLEARVSRCHILTVYFPGMGSKAGDVRAPRWRTGLRAAGSSCWASCKSLRVSGLWARACPKRVLGGQRSSRSKKFMESEEFRRYVIRRFCAT